MKIYLYAEHCNRAGQENIGEDADQTDDAFLYAEGERESIIAGALASLGERRDTRPGGSGDAFRWKCDREALRLLDGPEVEFCAKSKMYVRVAE